MIILLTMVLVSAVIVVLAGGALVEDLQTRAQANQADKTISSVDHELTQVLATQEAASLSPIGTTARGPTVREAGSATVAWIDENETSLPSPASACRVDVDPLGAIEYPHETGTVAYQSGGVWRQTSAGSTVKSPPEISYDGQRLQLGFIQVTAEDLTDSSAIAAVNTTTSEQLTTALERAARCGTAGTVVIRIQSQYHEGWYTHLNRSLRGGNRTVSVDHDTSNQTVTARIEAIQTAGDTPDVRTIGPTALTGTDGDGRVEYGTEPITVETTVTATNSPVANQQLTITIGGEAGVTASKTVMIRRNDARTVQLTVEPEKYTSKLQPGRSYNYDVLAGQTPLATGGSVYLGAADPTFSLRDPSTELRDGNVVISAALANEGVTDASASVSLELTPDETTPAGQYDIDPVTVERAPGATGRVSWQLSTDRVATGKHTYQISTDDDSLSGSLTVPATDVQTNGSQLAFDRRREINVTVLGPEVSSEQGTRHTDSGIVGGNRSSGSWRRTGSGNASLDWPGRTVPGGPSVEPTYNDSGGWLPQTGSLQCIRSDDLGCALYGFPNTTSFEYSDDGGYELDWEYDATGNWSWQGAGSFGRHPIFQKYWWPVTLDIGLEDLDSGQTTQLSPWRDEDAPAGESLNQFHERDRIHRHSLTVQPGTRLSFEATTWSCSDGSWDRSGQDTFAGIGQNRTTNTSTDWRGVWYHYDCRKPSSPLLRVDSRTATNPENVRSRDAIRSTIPELRAGAPRQESADELLGERFERRYDNGTGVLDLDEDEFVFLFEITDQPGENVTGSEYFDQARSATPGDPNFNDLIVLVELDDRGATPAGRGGQLQPIFDSESGEPAASQPGQSTTADDPGSGDSVDVEVDGDAIVVR